MKKRHPAKLTLFSETLRVLDLPAAVHGGQENGPGNSLDSQPDCIPLSQVFTRCHNCATGGGLCAADGREIAAVGTMSR
jgi:hypothetical protein